jgi:hypothetical protein
VTVSDTFTDIFRQEHRAVRDRLFDLIEAFRSGDTVRARDLLAEVTALTGPHFRYEEESLYPSLVEVFGREYVDKLLGDHDGAVRTVRRLIELAGRDGLDASQRAEAVAGVQSILPHVSDCDGLSIMVERFPEDRIRTILDTRRQAQASNLDLLTWAGSVRERPA